MRDDTWEDDAGEAVLGYGENGYDGPGWYYWDAEYPEEGSIGAFVTREAAEAHASGPEGGGYKEFILSTKHNDAAPEQPGSGDTETRER